LKQHIDKIREHCVQYNVKELYAVGSLANGKLSAKSDIDFLISFNDIPIDEYTDNYFILHELFEKIFNRKIDLITNRSLGNPYFIGSINKNKLLVYAGSKRAIR
jgi:uncharacterized protein